MPFALWIFVLQVCCQLFRYASIATLPLTEDVVNLLLKIKEQRQEGYPYVFILPERYDRIQATRKGQSGKKKKACQLEYHQRLYRDVDEIKSKAQIKQGTFHDIRRTATAN